MSAVLALGSRPAPAAGAESDPRALLVADRLEAAMGGRARFDAHRFLKFRFAVERDGKEAGSWLHYWDRATGRYRLEGRKDSHPLLVLFNVNDRQGEVWLDGAKLDPEAAKPHLEEAYGRFINDSYWLLMPWKWRDPGVTLHYEGERTVEGELFDVVSLTFQGVGLTPNDHYWGIVSKKDGLLKRWEFVLQTEEGAPGTGEPAAFSWEEWQVVGEGLLLSCKKAKLGSEPALAIVFPVLDMAKAIDDSVFAPPPPPGSPH
jgi:hypothetical protein